MGIENGNSEMRMHTGDYFFSKIEVAVEIMLLAQAEGIVAADLQPEPGKETYDSEGNLTYFSMEVNQERAREKKCGNIWYIYVVKGTDGPLGVSPVTMIVRADSTIENPGEVDWATQLVEYDDKEKVWR